MLILILMLFLNSLFNESGLKYTRIFFYNLIILISLYYCLDTSVDIGLHISSFNVQMFKEGIRKIVTGGVLFVYLMGLVFLVAIHLCETIFC